MTSIRHLNTSGVLAACLAAAAAWGCGGESPPAAAPVASAPPAVSTPPAPPPPAPVASASAAPAAPPPAATPVPGATGELADAEEHRRHHGGGISMLLAMSLRDLELTADQKAAVDKIHDDLKDKMAPVRAADRELATILADGVAAGKVDKAKVDKAVDKVVAEAQKVRAATGDALVRLHTALTPAQRADSIDKLKGHFEKWKAAHGQDESDDAQHRSGHLLALVRDLSLTQDEAQKIKAAFKAQMKGAKPQDSDHKDVQDHLKAFETAFKADKFDPKTASSANADKHMARWGASRRATLLEVAAPVLTPDQRTKLADMIRPKADEAGK